MGKIVETDKVECKTVNGRVPLELLNKAEDIAFTEKRVRKVTDLLVLALTEYVDRRAQA